MAAYHGRGGAILVDSVLADTLVAMGEITAWSYNENVEDTEAPAMGQTSKRYLAGLSEAGGTFAVNYDDGDTEQEALEVGDSVKIELWPRGGGSLFPEFISTGNDASDQILITGIEVSADTGSVITRSYTFRNNLIRGTQPA